MYPKNAASPEPVAIGPVVLIADGTVQTSLCTVRIKPIGVAEADGGGTTAYSTDGIILYTPTQAETNYTSFILIAKKTACIPASVTIITTSSATPGTVLLAPVTHTSAVVPTVTTLTNLPAITAGWLTAAGIASDAITDAKVASDVTIASVTGAVGSVAGDVGGSVVGSVSSVTAAIVLPTIPTDWITAGGIATDAIGSAEISAAAANKLADHSRRRTQANVEASSDGDTLSLGSQYGLIQQAQESAVAATTLTVYRTDGVTSLGTKSLTGDAAADPIIAIQ